jgi:hypothetical protein
MFHEVDFEHAAEVLGRCTLLGNSKELSELQDSWSHADWRAWFMYLDTPIARGMQWRGFAWAPGGRMCQGAAGFRKRMDAHALRGSGSGDPRRSAIARAAFAALRNGSDNRSVLIAALHANCQLSDPLPPTDVERIVTWARERMQEAVDA